MPEFLTGHDEGARLFPNTRTSSTAGTLLAEGHAAIPNCTWRGHDKGPAGFQPLVGGAMLASMSEGLDLDVSALARVCLGKADIRLLVIFGSVALGKARADSDVDVGILGGAS